MEPDLTLHKSGNRRKVVLHVISTMETIAKCQSGMHLHRLHMKARRIRMEHADIGMLENMPQTVLCR